MSLGKRTGRPERPLPSFLQSPGGAPYDAEASDSPYDAEAAEQENDRQAGELGERVSMLKRITSDIHDEVENQHKLLDRMGDGFDGVRATLAGTMERVTRAFNDKGSRKLLYVAGGTALVLFVLYYAVRQ